ncbi:tetratricopeptide repeat protein [Tropicimonas marinistellae]|uniref:tetratricopeptide repeat-containing glycosyltransferase family protein n=1 Tax=Tropicimonas marinistellae TaxID=1739787 RepID=UPI00082A659C|nr:tetratricopeptide repeat-containing glycosyltransferase family protein [Tropicimonas marinistellae]
MPGSSPGDKNAADGGAPQAAGTAAEMVSAETLRAAALAHHRRGETSRAAALYTKYLMLRPDDATVWSNLGVLMRQSGQRKQSLRFQQRAYRLAPNLRIVRNNLANALGDSGRNEEAAAFFRELLDEAPDDPDAGWNLGRHLRALGRYDEALDVLQAARKRFRGKSQVRLQLALTQLAAGDYRSGFANYDARFSTGDVARPRIDLPRWNGAPLAGKSLLVLREQGLGDSLLCARFLPLLREQGARVHMVCRPPVLRLFENSGLADIVSTEVPDLSGYDMWTSMFDLPRHYFRTEAAPPAPAEFNVPQVSRDRAQALLSNAGDDLRIGVVWSGSVTYKANHLRAFGHEAFLPLADLDGVRLYSLYKGPLLKEYFEDASNAVLIDTASNDADLADCAATIEQMDLVITADTATAHLAGSLGKEVWNLLHWDPFWLYGHHGDRTPWYRSMRLYRQRRPMDWDGVFAQVRRDLFSRLVGTQE